MKMYIIDAQNKQIKEAEYTGLESLQSAVDGYIETAYDFPNNDCIYVNEEGLYQGYDYGFVVWGAHQPFLGNGVMVGIDPESGETAEVKTPLEEVKRKIKFITMDQLRKMYGR